MATEKQIAANRRNALRSTGPRTPQGKARSRMNALSHGLSYIGHGVQAAKDGDLAEGNATKAMEIVFESLRKIWIQRAKMVAEMNELHSSAQTADNLVRKIKATSRYEGRLSSFRKYGNS